MAQLDTLYTAETPEGIALALHPAGVVARGLAFAVDFGIRFGIYFLGGTILGFGGGLGVALLLILFFLLEWFYPVIFELGMSGATPGKRALGLQVVMDSGLPVTPAASITRNLLRAADFMPALFGFALVSMLLRRDFKRLGDMAAGTLVVYAERVSLHAAPPEAAPQAPARALVLAEQEAVIAWAGRIPRLTSERVEELAQLAQPVLEPAAGRAAPRLLGVAQWLLGRRGGDAPQEAR